MADVVGGRRHVEPIAGFDELAEEAERATDAEQMRKVADRLRAVAREKEGLVARAQKAVDAAADAAESAQPAGEAAAIELRRAAKEVAVVAPKMAALLTKAADGLAAASSKQSISDAQMRRTHAVRAKTAAWAPELAASHAKGGTAQRDALFGYVRKLFSHPLDSDWWQEPMLKWARLPGNQERLEAYIKVRNSGRIHHHK